MMNRLFIPAIAGAVLVAGVTAGMFIVPALTGPEPPPVPEPPKSVRLALKPMLAPIIEDRRGRRGTEAIQLVITLMDTSVQALCPIEPLVVEASLGELTARPLVRGQGKSVSLGHREPDLRKVILAAVGKYIVPGSLTKLEAHVRSAQVSTRKQLKLLKVDYVCLLGNSERL